MPAVLRLLRRCFNRKVFASFSIGFCALLLLANLFVFDQNFRVRIREQCASLMQTDAFVETQHSHDLIGLGDTKSVMKYHALRTDLIPPRRKVKEVSCLTLMEGDENEIGKAEKLMESNPKVRTSDRQIEELAGNCARFKEEMKFNQDLRDIPLSKEEVDFPIAYSIICHQDAAQVTRLVRNIYRPQNFYCIHVDAKSSPELLSAIRRFADCFSNVFVAEKREAIVYAHFTRLKADLNCMAELANRSSTWKYVINLTGQMFPLKTNRELVKILETLRGTNDIEGLSKWVTGAMSARFEKRWTIGLNGRLINSGLNKTAPPHGINLVKGSAFGAFTRDFVQFVISDKIARDFLDWSRDVYSPDEIFWATINSRWINPMFKSPGGYDAAPERRPWLSTFAAWMKVDSCRGKFVRTICIFGVGDLPKLITRREMFANKFYSDYHPLVIDCLEEWLFNKTAIVQPFDLEFYRRARYYLDEPN